MREVCKKCPQYHICMAYAGLCSAYQKKPRTNTNLMGQLSSAIMKKH